MISPRPPKGNLFVLKPKSPFGRKFSKTRACIKQYWRYCFEIQRILSSIYLLQIELHFVLTQRKPAQRPNTAQTSGRLPCVTLRSCRCFATLSFCDDSRRFLRTVAVRQQRGVTSHGVCRPATARCRAVLAVSAIFAESTGMAGGKRLCGRFGCGPPPAPSAVEDPG
jgi:hypothetical protein